MLDPAQPGIRRGWGKACQRFWGRAAGLQPAQNGLQIRRQRHVSRWIGQHAAAPEGQGIVTLHGRRRRQQMGQVIAERRQQGGGSIPSSSSAASPRRRLGSWAGARRQPRGSSHRSGRKDVRCSCPPGGGARRLGSGHPGGQSANACCSPSSGTGEGQQGSSSSGSTSRRSRSGRCFPSAGGGMKPIAAQAAARRRCSGWRGLRETDAPATMRLQPWTQARGQLSPGKTLGAGLATGRRAVGRQRPRTMENR